MKKSFYVLLTIALVAMLFSCEKEDLPTDPSKNYESVTIGTQVWMIRNLDVTHYRNGDSIPEVRDSATWVNLKTGAWCYYNNDSANGEIYGKLYNWYAVNDTRDLAPAGWHIASDEEWKIMEMYLGMSNIDVDRYGQRGTDEGSKLAGIADLWSDGVLVKNQNFGSSGFLGLPSGVRYSIGKFSQIGNYGYWWSSSVYTDEFSWYRNINHAGTNIKRDGFYRQSGSSVRCVRD